MGLWIDKIAIVFAAAAISAACSEEQPAGGESTGGTVTEQPTGGETPATLTDQTRQRIRTALGAYEQIRAKLVADDGNVAEQARQIADAAAAAQEGAPEALRSHLSGLATEARQLAEAPASEMARVRSEFGDVSRHVIGLLSAERSLAEGLHVFECGMAEGYGKWVQRSAEISNPYMGTRMPACGARSELDES